MLFGEYLARFYFWGKLLVPCTASLSSNLSAAAASYRLCLADTTYARFPKKAERIGRHQFFILRATHFLLARRRKKDPLDSKEGRINAHLSFKIWETDQGMPPQPQEEEEEEKKRKMDWYGGENNNVDNRNFPLFSL